MREFRDFWSVFERLRFDGFELHAAEGRIRLTSTWRPASEDELERRVIERWTGPLP